MDTVKQLQLWYHSHCDGDWEHQYGVKIDTLDNPGWAVDIDLSYTELDGLAYDTVTIERSEHDWIHCSVRENVFSISCGPRNLEEGLQMFLEWTIEVARSN